VPARKLQKNQQCRNPELPPAIAKRWTGASVSLYQTIKYPEPLARRSQINSG